MNSLRNLARLTRLLLTVLTLAVLFVFTYELVGIVAFRFLYTPAPSFGFGIVLALHCALSVVLTLWLYAKVFHSHLWK